MPAWEILIAIKKPANLFFPPQSGKFAGASADGQDASGQGLDNAEDVAEHEQMTAVLRNSLQLGDTTPSVLPGLRTRTRASRGASKPTVLWLSVDFRMHSSATKKKKRITLIKRCFLCSCRTHGTVVLCQRRHI